MSLISKVVSLVTGKAHDAVDALTDNESAVRQQQRVNEAALDKLNDSLTSLKVELSLAQGTRDSVKKERDNWERLAVDNSNAARTEGVSAEDKASYEAKANKCLDKAEALDDRLAASEASVTELKKTFDDISSKIELAKTQINNGIEENATLEIKAGANKAKQAAVDALNSAGIGSNSELEKRIERDSLTADAKLSVVEAPEDFRVPAKKEDRQARLDRLTREQSSPQKDSNP